MARVGMEKPDDFCFGSGSSKLNSLINISVQISVRGPAQYRFQHVCFPTNLAGRSLALQDRRPA